MEMLFIKDCITENNVTLIWSNSVSGDELVRPSIFIIDVVDGEWWTLNANFGVFPSSSVRVYLFSIFCPINSMYFRILINYKNVSNQFNWTSFNTVCVKCRNSWSFCNEIRLAIMIIAYLYIIIKNNTYNKIHMHLYHLHMQFIINIFVKQSGILPVTLRCNVLLKCSPIVFQTRSR